MYRHLRGTMALVVILLVTSGSWPAAARESPLKALPPAPGLEPAPFEPLPLQADRDGDRISDDMATDLAAAAGTDRFEVIVQLAGPATSDTDTALARQIGPFTPRARWTAALHGFAASLTRTQIETLSRLPQVKQIEADAEVQAFLDTATRDTGVAQARLDFQVDGDRDGNPAVYTSADVVVAVLDTGIDAAHVDLDGGKVIAWRDEINGAAAPYDDHGHGSHVAGIIAGTGEGNPAYRGVAPGAALVGIKVLSGAGSGTTTQIINGINWMIQNRTRYNIAAGNLSLGSSGCSDGRDALSTAVNNAVQSGITMVVAAGNSGPARCTIGSPAAAAQAITVGAAYDIGELGWAIADFSSRGPTADGRTKPDLVTPGRNITAVKANTANQYVAYSGTSMATPFLAGVVALMLDANPGQTPADVKRLLYDPANYEDRGSAGRDIDFGYGLNLVYQSVRAAGGFGGTFDDGQDQRSFSGRLSRRGAQADWFLPVSATTAPLAVTLVMTDWRGYSSPDFDLYLYDPSGRLVGRSEGITRQEQIRLRPARTGTYRVRVTSYTGSGAYFVDASYK